MTTLIEKIVGDLGDKHRRRTYKEVERGITNERSRLVNAVERGRSRS